MDPRQTKPPHGPDAPARDAGPNGAGWDWRSEFERDAPQWRPGLPDFSPIFALLDAVRRAIPPELQDQFAALQREVLLTIRALIDWYLERLDARSRPVEVEDIPID
jgi:hypothetical protein